VGQQGDKEGLRDRSGILRSLVAPCQGTGIDSHFVTILTYKSPLSWLPALPAQIWLLAGGRLLSQLGTGFTLFYAPIFFVQQVGLSATEVGLALGSGSIAGVIGRFCSGGLCDSAQAGRRSALLLAAAISAFADVFLATAANLPSLILGNLLMGLGIGLYWPATETVVADLTRSDQRGEAFAVTRVCDSLGLGFGVILAGLWLQWTHNYRILFVVDGISFVAFFGLVFLFIAETRPDYLDRSPHPTSLWTSLKTSLRTSLQPLSRDRALQIFLCANILFTTYLSQIQSTLPLYFSQSHPANTDSPWFSAALISRLFAGHVVLTAILQLPIARRLSGFGHLGALRLSGLLWALGFAGVGLLGWLMAQNNLAIAAIVVIFAAFLLLALLSIAVVCYLPASAALVVELAPPSQRGIYLALSSQCWAVGYFLGPPLGGWALDQSATIAQYFWWSLALTVLPLQIALLWLQSHRKDRLPRPQG